MDVGGWLASAEGADALAAAQAAQSVHPDDPLAAGAALRRSRPHLPASQAAAALEQASLGRWAAERYGVDAGNLLLTRAGLEQATRPEVAARRAATLARAGARRVVDLTAGLGFDSAAFAAAGLQVTAVERDPDVAAFCAHNVPAARVVVADATSAGVLDGLLEALEPTDVVFVDPARRSGVRDLGSGRARPERDPERWSPPWSFIDAIAHDRIVVKAAPSFEPPAGWSGEWISVARDMVECSAYSWPALPAARQAACLTSTGWHGLAAVASPLDVAIDLGPWLVEPDDAVVRARAVSGLLALHPGLRRVDPDSSWLTCHDHPGTSLTGLARAFRVTEELAGSKREQRDRLRQLGIQRLTIKNRDTREDPRHVLKALGCREGTDSVLVQTRRSGRVISLLVDAVPVPHG